MKSTSNDQVLDALEQFIRGIVRDELSAQQAVPRQQVTSVFSLDEEIEELDHLLTDKDSSSALAFQQEEQLLKDLEQFSEPSVQSDIEALDRLIAISPRSLSDKVLDEMSNLVDDIMKVSTAPAFLGAQTPRTESRKSESLFSRLFGT